MSDETKEEQHTRRRTSRARSGKLEPVESWAGKLKDAARRARDPKKPEDWLHLFMQSADDPIPDLHLYRPQRKIELSKIELRKIDLSCCSNPHAHCPGGIHCRRP